MDRLTIVQQLGRAYRAFLGAYEAYVGVCVPRWRILLRLYEEPPPCSQKQLVEILGMDPGALSRQLKSLEALGWVSRSNDPHDARITNVFLTEAGKDEVKKTLPRRHAFFQEALVDIPEAEQERLMRDLALLEERFRKVAKQAQPPSGKQ